MRVVVSGAGVAGLLSSLMLARDGHEVVLLERDATPLPPDAESAFGWDRRGAPQVRHSHAFLARLRNLLRDELPDVLAELTSVGALEVSWLESAPETLDDRTPHPGDEDLGVIACRRTTFEWVLRRAVLNTNKVALRDGVRVTGLIAGERSGIPLVTGVHTSAGDVEADLIVDAGGRHSPLRAMLTDAGIELREEKYSSDMVYLSRFYRLLPGVSEPDKQVFVGGAIGYGGFAVFRGDNRAFSITLAIGSEDTELRDLIDEDRFDIAMSMLPAAQRWINGDTAEPIGKMHVMGDLINRCRDLVIDGRPAVLGLTAIGDALICTNPLYGRGCSLGGVHARLLTSAVEAQGGDLEALALQMHDDAQREIVPWYKASVAQDAAARAMRESGGVSSNPNDPGSIFTEGLLPLTRVDAYAHRALARMMNLLSPPDSLFGDEELMKRALAFWMDRDKRPPEPPMGPPREEMVAALKAVAPA